jgi:hypothetical protein
MAKRRRAPGGGRKPMGAFRAKSATLTTRITPGIRQALETERESGESISQFAERMIDLGLKETRRRRTPDTVRALGQMIGELASVTCAFKNAEGEPAFDWLTHPFFFRALQLAIGKFMDGIAPAGEIRSPIDEEPALANALIWGPHDKPEELADFVARAVLHALYSAAPRGARQPTVEERFGLPNATAEEEARLARTQGTLSQAAESLLPAAVRNTPPRSAAPLTTYEDSPAVAGAKKKR